MTKNGLSDSPRTPYVVLEKLVEELNEENEDLARNCGDCRALRAALHDALTENAQLKGFIARLSHLAKYLNDTGSRLVENSDFLKKMLRNLIVGGFFAVTASANAQELIPFQLVIKINPALALAFNPSAPSIACNIPGGTVVAAISATGGDGNPITLSISGDTTDFALSSTTLPSNVIVASGGITSATGKCPLTATVTETVTINASQP